MAQELHIHISINSRFVGALLLIASFISVPIELGSETITLSTTYPSPVGIYNRIITTGTGPTNTILNQNRGYTILVPPTNTDTSPNGGRVLVGTNPPGAADNRPNVKLDITGTTRVIQPAGGIWEWPVGSGRFWGGGCTMMTFPNAACAPGRYATWVPGIYVENQPWFVSVNSPNNNVWFWTKWGCDNNGNNCSTGPQWTTWLTLSAARTRFWCCPR